MERVPARREEVRCLNASARRQGQHGIYVQTQFYATLGFDMRVAHYESGDKVVPDAVPWGHFYLGTSAGLGIDHRMDKSTALRFEVRGYMRGRTQGQGDALAKVAPTFAQDVKGDRGIAVSIGMVFY